MLSFKHSKKSSCTKTTIFLDIHENLAELNKLRLIQQNNWLNEQSFIIESNKYSIYQQILLKQPKKLVKSTKNLVDSTNFLCTSKKTFFCCSRSLFCWVFETQYLLNIFRSWEWIKTRSISIVFWAKTGGRNVDNA